MSTLGHWPELPAHDIEAFERDLCLYGTPAPRLRVIALLFFSDVYACSAYLPFRDIFVRSVVYPLSLVFQTGYISLPHVLGRQLRAY